MSNSVLLDRGEFLLLMRAAGARAVVGVPKEALDPSPGEAELLARGEASLTRRGLCSAGGSDAGARIDGSLTALAECVARPRRAVLVSCETPASPRQMTVLNEGERASAEHRVLAPDVHLLAPVQDVGSMLARIQELIHTVECAGGADEVLLSQGAFVSLLKLAEEERYDSALQLLAAHQMARDAAERLVEAMSRPVKLCTVAFLKCAAEEITDAREMTTLQGISTLWSITQETPGVPILRLSDAGSDEVRRLARRLFQELEGSS